MPNVNDHDLDLYQRYKRLFIDDGVAEFYRQHDFLGAFQEDCWSPLSEYVDNWHSVEFEFVDAKLQKAHKKLYASASRLGGKIAIYTVPIGRTGNLRSVKSDSLPPGPTPQAIIDQAREINELARSFANAHRQFVRLANRRLYVNEKFWTPRRVLGSIGSVVGAALVGVFLIHYESQFGSSHESRDSETESHGVADLNDQFKGLDDAKKELAFSLQVQADSVADRARLFVTQSLEPVTAGGGKAWWPIDTEHFDTYKKVQFRDHETGWVLGRQSIITTLDGGVTWSGRQFDSVNQFNDFTYVAPESVWLVANDGLVFRAQGGEKWTRVKVGTSEHLYGIEFLHGGVTGWIVGENGVLLKTDDAGETWAQQDTGTNRNLIAIHAFDSKRVWIGGSLVSLVTTDGGERWLTTTSEITFTDVLFLDDSFGVSTDSDGLNMTTDRGHNWQSLHLRGRNIALRGFSFTDADTGWIANLYGQVFHTEDGGKSWSTQQSGARQLNDLYFVDKSVGWAVGDNGTLLQSAPLSLVVDGKNPNELLAMLKDSIARSYFEREGVLERLQDLANEYETSASAIHRLQQVEESAP